MAKTSTINNRGKIAWLIIQLHLLMLLVAFSLYLFQGYDDEELQTLLAILTPITGVYFGMALKEMGSSSNDKEDIHPYQSQIKKLIYFVFGGMILLIILKGIAPNILPFNSLKLLLAGLETYFGVHMGNLFKSLFNE